MGQRKFLIQNAYIVCQQCGGRILRRAALDKLKTLALTECWNASWPVPQGWQGHVTHQMWRKGQQVACINCKARANAGDQTWTPSRALRLRCGGIEPEQQTLPQIFKAKNA